MFKKLFCKHKNVAYYQSITYESVCVCEDCGKVLSTQKRGSKHKAVKLEDGTTMFIKL